MFHIIGTVIVTIWILALLAPLLNALLDMFDKPKPKDFTKYN